VAGVQARDLRPWILIRAAGDHPDPVRRYLHSNLVSWFEPLAPEFSGSVAIGIATPPASVPSTGVLTYQGVLEGRTSERYLAGGQQVRGTVTADVTLTFDASAGTVRLSFTPRIETSQAQVLAPVVADLVLDRATGRFRQPGPYNPQSPIPFISGQFTGPNGGELIGDLDIKYRSAVTDTDQNFLASFIAKR
jgi:hypothetical protein